jgi:hypothetical protein
MIQLAIDKNLDLEKFERLIDLKNKEEERLAKKEFDYHFALMQKDYLPATKTKSVKSESGVLLYKYCPLENILEIYQPILSRHNFSYRWSQSVDEKNGMIITCIVAGWGYEINSSVPVNILPGNKFSNGNQQIGSSISYGKRYSFCDALGIIIKDEDTDNNTVKPDNHNNSDQVETENIETIDDKSVSLTDIYRQAAAALRDYPNKSITIHLGKIMNSIRDDAKKLTAFIEILNDRSQPKTIDFVEIVKRRIA